MNIKPGLDTFLQLGTGAVSRRITDRLRDSVSVFDYMTQAEIDDVRAGTQLVNVAAAVQTAWDENDCVEMPAGVYYMGSTALTITDPNKRIIGDGRSTQLSWAAAFVGVGITISMPRCHLENFYVQKPKQASAPPTDGTLIAIENTSDTGSYKNIVISSEGAGANLGWGFGMKLYDWVHKLDDCEFSAYARALYCSKVNYVASTRCNFSAQAAQVILMDGGGGNSFKDFDVEGNAPVGLLVQDGATADSGNATIAISGGYMEGQDTAIQVLGSVGPGKDVRGVTIHGVFISGQGGLTDYGIDIDRAHGVSVVGCCMIGLATNSYKVGANVTAAQVVFNYFDTAASVHASANGFFQKTSTTLDVQAALAIQGTLSVRDELTLLKTVKMASFTNDTAGFYLNRADDLAGFFGGSARLKGAMILLGGETFANPSLGRLGASVDGAAIVYPLRWDNVGGVERLCFFDVATPIVKPTVTGSLGGNAALGSLVNALEALGLIIDTTSA